jgi:hypothetical protein
MPHPSLAQAILIVKEGCLICGDQVVGWVDKVDYPSSEIVVRGRRPGSGEIARWKVQGHHGNGRIHFSLAIGRLFSLRKLVYELMHIVASSCRGDMGT